jgi:hypothetical protein
MSFVNIFEANQFFMSHFMIIFITALRAYKENQNLALMNFPKIKMILYSSMIVISALHTYMNKFPINVTPLCSRLPFACQHRLLLGSGLLRGRLFGPRVLARRRP